ncbi:MAG: hypothetical protein ACK45X_11465 [Roseiflexaceae bacterium]
MSDKPTTQFRVTGFWLAGLGMVAGLAVLSLLLSWIPSAVLTGLPVLARVGFAIALTLIPALLWVFIFMRQDRLEPEPREYVLGLFVLGIAAGAGIYRPLVDLLLLADWGQGNIAIVTGFIEGLLLSALIYVAVRMTIMPTNELDERVDGMIYAIAFALGVATAEGIVLVVGRTVRSYAAIVQIVAVDAMLVVALAIVVGYILGMIRPGRANGWLMVVGLIGGGVVWAAHDMVRRTVTVDLNSHPMLSAVPSLVIMLVVFGLFSVLLTRAYANADTTNDMQLPIGRADIPVAIVTVVVIVIALVLRGDMVYAGKVVSHGPLRVTIPGGMLPVTPGAAYPQQNLNGIQYDVQVQPSSGDLSTDAARVRLVRGAACRDMGLAGETRTSINQTVAVIQEYVCLPSESGADAVRGFQLLVAKDGTLYTVSVAGAERSASTVETYWREMLARLSVQ